MRKESIDKSFFSKVSSASAPRRPVDRCFREVNGFSDFRFEEKIETSEETFRRNYVGCRI